MKESSMTDSDACRQQAAPLPLLVELDWVLLRTSIRAELANRTVTRHPFRGSPQAFKLAFGGKDDSDRVLDPATLPYSQAVLDKLRAEQADGRELVLLARCELRHAEAIAAHLGIFDRICSEPPADGNGFELLASNERRAWPTLRTILRGMRIHQWAKNVLLFVPLLGVHGYGDAAKVLEASIAFLAFGLVASSVYLLNDLADAADDRLHPRKRTRVIASGELSLRQAWLAWPLLLLAGVSLSWFTLSATFTTLVIAYLVQTTLYSTLLKQMPLVDVLVLACLYTLRIIAGAVAIRVPTSFWLLCFSMFLFTSLAFVKRYSELNAMSEGKRQDAYLHGRGYRYDDAPLIATMGVSSGYLAILVLAMYIHDDKTAQMYSHPELIWLACPLLMFWVSRVWLIARRGWMHDDPIVFALKDHASRILAVFLVLIVLSARLLPASL